MKMMHRLGIAAFLFLSLAAPARASGGVRDAVVKVFVTSNRIDYFRPWQSQGIQSATGSGCVIEGGQILTNAHVVADHTFIQVRKEANPKKYTARVKAIGSDCDLAVLTVDDPEFLKDVTPLSLGDLPQLQDAVAVIGFPVGGEKISITEGVVSRVEIVPYAQSAKKLLAVQIDAAINPGNSGGPVLQDGKLVGVAMQMMMNSQNIGYMIPTPVIRHFLGDLKDGRYDGFPTLGIEFRGLENDALREFLHVKETDGGVVLSRVLPFSPAWHVLKEDDVVLNVDNIPVGTDGTFEFRKGERLNLSYLINAKQNGDTMRFKISRQGKVQDIALKLESFVNLIPGPYYFDRPPYYIYGGMIFTVLTVDLLQAWGNEWWEKSPIDFLYYLIGNGRLNADERRELVVMLEILPDDVNVGYHNYRHEVIQRVNGRPFTSFREFVDLVETTGNGYTIFETDANVKIVLEKAAAERATPGILERNNIPAQYSKDVEAWRTPQERVVSSGQ